VATRYPSNGDAHPQPAVLVTIHGRVWRGLLRGRSWSEEHGGWRCTVEIRVDDRAVVTSVPADQVEIAAPPDADRDGDAHPGEPQ
jgi:hypothetical protein